jgi:hypothetical protein
MDTWRLSILIDRIVKRWVILLIFILGGGLLGFLGTQLIPFSYRAEADLYVGIDVQRVGEMAYVIPLAKHEPLNLEDYKNWQLKQVADLTRSDKILQATLDQLKKDDPSWSGLSLAEFQKMVDIYWYDAGVWHLEVTHLQKEQAERAVLTWRDITQQELQVLLDYGETAAQKESRLRVYTESLADLERELAQAEVLLTELQDRVEQIQARIENNDELPSEIRSEIQVWLDGYQSTFLDHLLPEDDPVSHSGAETLESFLVLEERVLEYKSVLESEKINLEEDRDKVLEEYHQAQDLSKGLSANIYLEQTSKNPQLSQVQSTGLVTLLSGFAGLIIWLMIVFLGIGTKDA